MSDQMEVNFFGLLNVTQAVLPILRKQGSGHIIQMSTIGGVMAFSNLGAYNASKWAVEGLSEALAQEVGQFGINVTLIEPGLFDTDWRGSSAVHAEPLPHYESLREAAKNRAVDPSMIGDPKAAGQAILTIADAEKPPLRVFFGKRPVEAVPAAYEARLKGWDEWKHVSLAANGH
jgi:NAD(P)-dependent dehydrogenase (short-subunit alcohol dehydrogenase family)